MRLTDTESLNETWGQERNLMMLRVFVASAFVILKVAFSTEAMAVTNDCPGDVYVDGAALVVEPTGSDDTENLQCAVDSASRQALKAVRLEAGDYYIDQLLISNFEGSIEGKSIGTTRLRLSRRQLDCPKEDFETIIAPITVKGGDTVFRYMTIDASAGPCFRGDFWSILLYTQQSCSSRVAFGAVDRVRVIGDRSSGSVGITAVSQPACAAIGNGALGTFRVNRVALESVGVGVRTSKVGVAQVDINFSDFTEVGTGIQIFNANQSTSIVSNRIEYNTGPTTGAPMGIFVDTTEAWAPEENRTVIHQNALAQGTFDDSSRAVVLSNSTIEADHSAVITRNVFQLKSNSRSANNGVVITDTDNVTIVDNRFLGSANYSIYVDSPTWFQNRRNTEGTVINRNDFTDIVPRTAADIFLGGGTSLSLVGPQAAAIKDSGADNFIAESTAQADVQSDVPDFSPSGDSSGAFDDGDSDALSGFEQ